MRMKIRMITLKAHRYAGKYMKPGEVFMARRKSDAKLMKALGWAEERAEPVKVEPKLEPRPLYQAWRKVVPTIEEEVKPKRKYTRRDLTAENS